MRVTRQQKRANMKVKLRALQQLMREHRPLIQAMEMLDRAKEEGYQAGLAAGQSKSDAADETISAEAQNRNKQEE